MGGLLKPRAGDNRSRRNVAYFIASVTRSFSVWGFCRFHFFCSILLLSNFCLISACGLVQGLCSSILLSSFLRVFVVLRRYVSSIIYLQCRSLFVVQGSGLLF